MTEKFLLGFLFVVQLALTVTIVIQDYRIRHLEDVISSGPVHTDIHEREN